MKLAVIGFGNAGGKIADRLLEFEIESGRALCRFVCAINTAEIDLERLETIPPERRVLLGQTHELSKGHGVGADPDLGAEIARTDRVEIERALDEVPLHEIDAFLVIAGLGGGTGSGGAAVVASQLREYYGESVYGLAILPHEDEGGRATLNAARSLPTFADATDNLLVFDNDAWRSSGDSVLHGYARTNQEIAVRVGTLLGAGEADGSTVSENAMDASDIRRTLNTGGISTIAHASASLEASTEQQRGLLGRLWGGGSETNGTDTTTKVHGLVRQAVESRLTLPADVSTAERSLIVVSGPPSEFSQKGLDRSRQWLEDRTESVEVLAGDDPREHTDVLSATVLLSNVTNVPRIKQLQRRAIEAQENIKQQGLTREEEIEALLHDDGNRLDPL